MRFDILGQISDRIFTNFLLLARLIEKFDQIESVIINRSSPRKRGEPADDRSISAFLLDSRFRGNERAVTGRRAG
jgi:hypothetical protein